MCCLQTRKVLDIFRESITNIMITITTITTTTITTDTTITTTPLTRIRDVKAAQSKYFTINIIEIRRLWYLFKHYF